MSSIPKGTPALTLAKVSKAYPGVQALDGVDLVAYPGEVLAICGANGAGKSTLAKLIAGQERPSDGEVRISGVEHDIRTPSEAADSGVLFMHQEPLVIEDFTVSENVWLSGISAQKGNRALRMTAMQTADRTLRALAAVGMRGLPLSTRAGDLAPGSRQMLALSRTQVQDHDILILDETTASTTEEHFKVVQELVRRERDAGVCVIFVSHRMDEVFAMSDRIAVLRGGKLVDIVRTADTARDDVVTLMIGEALESMEAPLPGDCAPEPVLTATGVVAGGARGVTMTAGAGEVVGIYGLVGSGRSSFARAITGNMLVDEGRLTLRGKPVRFRSNRDAMARGIVYLSEDRKREGFVKDFSNGFNMTLSTLGEYATGGVINVRKERKRVLELTAEYQVKGGPNVLTRTLSGGNQQKVCIARGLEAGPSVVVLDEPTKGIDVRARLNIYNIIRALAEQGKTVIVVSSEAEELLSICHRIVVMRDGEIVSERPPRQSTTDDLIRDALEGVAA